MIYIQMRMSVRMDVITVMSMPIVMMNLAPSIVIVVKATLEMEHYALVRHTTLEYSHSLSPS